MRNYRVFAFVFLLFAPLVVQAQVAFTVTATANTTAYGYVEDQAYSFVFVTGATFTINEHSTFTTSYGHWNEATFTDDQLFTSLSGGGLAGSFVRPAAPQSYIELDTNVGAVMTLYAGTNNYAGPTGLTTLSGAAIGSVIANVITFADPGFVGLNNAVDPATYFPSYFGTYALGNGQIVLNDTANDTLLVFTPTNLVIGASGVIPEPSTCAALAGLLMLGIACWRRQRV